MHEIVGITCACAEAFCAHRDPRAQSLQYAGWWRTRRRVCGSPRVARRWISSSRRFIVLSMRRRCSSRRLNPRSVGSRDRVLDRSRGQHTGAARRRRGDRVVDDTTESVRSTGTSARHSSTHRRQRAGVRSLVVRARSHGADADVELVDHAGDRHQARRQATAREDATDAARRQAWYQRRRASQSDTGRRSCRSRTASARLARISCCRRIR